MRQETVITVTVLGSRSATRRAMGARKGPPKRRYVPGIRMRNMLWAYIGFALCIAGTSWGTPYLRIAYTYWGNPTYPSFHRCFYWGLVGRTLEGPGDCPLIVVLRPQEPA